MKQSRLVSAPAMLGPVGREEGRIISRLAWPIALEQIPLIFTGILASMSRRISSGRWPRWLWSTCNSSSSNLADGRAHRSLVLVARMTGAGDTLAPGPGEAPPSSPCRINWWF